MMKNPRSLAVTPARIITRETSPRTTFLIILFGRPGGRVGSPPGRHDDVSGDNRASVSRTARLAWRSLRPDRAPGVAPVRGLVRGLVRGAPTDGGMCGGSEGTGDFGSGATVLARPRPNLSGHRRRGSRICALADELAQRVPRRAPRPGTACARLQSGSTPSGASAVEARREASDCRTVGPRRVDRVGACARGAPKGARRPAASAAHQSGSREGHWATGPSRGAWRRWHIS